MHVFHVRGSNPLPGEIDSEKWRGNMHRMSVDPEDLSRELSDIIAAEGGAGLVSIPPVGCFKVTNLYVDANGKLVIQWSDGTP
jgi:hypothetical protein